MSAANNLAMPDNATLLADRSVIRLSPIAEESRSEVFEFLQGLVTQDVFLLEKGAPLWSALLTAQGKVLYDFILWAEGSSILIDCESAIADNLIRRLTLYRLRRAIRIEIDPAIAVHWSLNPPENQAISSFSDPRLSELGFRWLQPATDSQPSAEAIWKKHRLAWGVTEGQAELGLDKTLWLEANARELNGVSFTKGCYVGQENTARMNWRQKINRRLAVIKTDHPLDDDKCRIYYSDLKLAVMLLRVADWNKLPDDQEVITPEWLKEALAEAHS